MNNRLIDQLPLFLRTRMALAIVVLTSILMVWHFSTHSESARPSNAGLTVTAITVENKPLNSTLELFGKVVAQEQVPVYADMMQGRITKVLVDEGDHVKAGQQLAVVDTQLAKVQRVQSLASKQRAIVAFSEAEAALDDAKKTLDQARTERVRGEKVAEDGLISKELLEQRIQTEQAAESKLNTARNRLRMALSDLLSANAQVDEADLKIKQAELVAPVSGLVIQRNAVVGQLLSQTNQSQFLLAKDGTLEVDIETSVEVAASLTHGMPVQVKIKDAERSYAGHIRKKGIMVHDENQMLHLKVAFSKAPALSPGQAATVLVTLPQRNAIRVPDSAIAVEGDQYYVYSVEQGHAKRIAVTIGQRLDGEVEILSGVSPGMRLIDKFAGFIREGEPVNVIAAVH
ncbi:efflux RND transporter periplasmic adaptor subunit [Methylophilus glucosoxydans]|jgi:HlyD family secretion protein|uniref:Efflux RND transporter periplasmic adaptor subunit n=1 Tax=Methylophilus glucosoxydans TaxID=752553 RepID=A0ABW3GM30_9PROT|nr:efflux RND transporter periplasmic adaptor subunit [Methylophilus sp. VKM B-3414]MDT7850288.1 efflux RND transporter periplasmic adaptor subunit [Methylophilus sp. VKM B-3414]